MKLKATHILILSSIAPCLILYTNCSKNFEAASNSGSSSSLASAAPTPDSATPTGTKKIFIAAGKLGRTTMSCDDGLTWINNRSDLDKGVCWGNDPTTSVECDHDPRSYTGLDAGDGWLFTSFGWGYNGTIRRSRDGVNWDVIRSDGWGGGISYVKGVLASAWLSGIVTPDLGKTWAPIANSPIDGYDHAFFQSVGSKIFAIGRSGAGVSYDQGSTWKNISGPVYGSLAEGSGILVSIGTALGTNGGNNFGYASVSTDQGLTWTQNQIWSAQGDIAFNVIFDGSNFVNWAGNKMWKSADGKVWNSSLMSTLPYGGTAAVSYNPETKTYVSVTNGWGAWYGNQKFYRSKDGINWSELPAAAFTASHPMYKIILGEIDAKYCP